MPGWDSLQTAAAVHGGLELAGLILAVLAAALAGFAAWQLRNGAWPEWLDIGQYQLRSRFFEIACAVVLTLLIAVEALAYSYGLHRTTLTAAAEAASADRIRHMAAETQGRRAESPARFLKENSELRQKLNDAEMKLADLEKTQTRKRLSAEQKKLIVDALRPFAGQKVSIASIRGDDEGLALAQDFVSAFEAAGWDHHGEAGVSTQEWARDPVGIEITLNEKDARSDHIAEGVAALINVVRKLGLVYDNTVYMDNDVPAGQALLKVGKKLRK